MDQGDPASDHSPTALLLLRRPTAGFKFATKRSTAYFSQSCHLRPSHFRFFIILIGPLSILISVGVWSNYRSKFLVSEFRHVVSQTTSEK
jgi:hypothetical protein